MMEYLGKGEREPFPTVIMQLKLRNPSKDVEQLPFPPKEEIESISFECNKENIEELIEELTKIKEELEK